MTCRIKICGITRDADADAVVAAGADALGLNFVAASPRRVSVDCAAGIARRVAGATVRVGVFVDPEPAEVSAVLDAVELDVLQFHGDESGEFCRGFGKPYVKALRVRGALDLDALEATYGDACCLMLDAYVADLHGGTGARFDWDLWPRGGRQRLVLAGGLTPDNVGAAVTRLAPWGVDVAGGVEGERKSEKDHARIARFVAEVKRAGS